MKIIYLLIFFLFINSFNIFSDTGIILTPIDKTTLYENFSEDFSYPFSNSLYELNIDKFIDLRLIKEIEYKNPLFGNIFKVEILNGSYKGKIGYVTKDSTKLSDRKEKSFNKYFIGIWQKIAVKKNYLTLTKEKSKENILELLGTLEIGENNQISFYNDKYFLKGNYKLIDNDHMLISINDTNCIIENLIIKDRYLITPETTDSAIKIPAFYSFYGGTLQISFDSIYFIRKNINNKKNDNFPTVIMESLGFGESQYPENEEKSKYQIYFFKDLN